MNVVATRLKDLADASAAWSEDRWIGRTSTLRDGERVLGRLRIEGWMGNRATLEIGGATWRMGQQPFKSRWSVEPDPPAVGTLAFSSGLLGRRPLVLASGDELRWRMRSLWRGSWAWMRRDDELVRFERRRAIPRAVVAVSWTREIRDWPELEPLVGLGWWMLLERRSHSAAH
jgi:hypothetical protein